MAYFMDLVKIMVACLITNNIIFSQSLGTCAYLGVSKKVNSSVGMGLAVTMVIAVSNAICYVLYNFILVKIGMEYLDTLVFILVIAGLVQALDIFLRKFSPALYNSLGIYLALITTNCAVLGSAQRVITLGYDLLQSFVYGIFTGLGFLLAIVLMSGIREKLDLMRMPKPFRGFAIALVIAAIMSAAFMGLR